MPRSRKVTRKKTSAKRSMAPALDIKSSTDVKKALDIMKKHPLTIILVFANWCPHCHTFMSRWNKLKGVPNRTSPMISVEQQFSNELLSNMSDESGKPPQIDGYPTVLANSNRGNQNVGVQVSTGSDEALTNLAQGNANMNESENENNNTNSMNVENENNNTNAMNVENENTKNAMNVENENSTNAMNTENENGSFAASYSNESVTKNGKGSPRSTAKSAVHVKKLSAAVQKAVANASNQSMKEAKRLRGRADEELSFAPSGFASPPPRENSTMNGGAGTAGPSGLCRLSGGNKQPTLYSMLKELNMSSLETSTSASNKRTQRKRTKNRK
jgi:hypothetical protein